MGVVPFTTSLVTSVTIRYTERNENNCIFTGFEQEKYANTGFAERTTVMPNPPHPRNSFGMWAVSCLFPQRCCCTWEPCSDPSAQM
ncbi:hypothetical protein PCCS19_40650 [Paenibacillus sp. CCS19]|nr:hypothetical protein PCCS19_40650 [Paenibacillus cellulosilyticus]